MLLKGDFGCRVETVRGWGPNGSRPMSLETAVTLPVTEDGGAGGRRVEMEDADRFGMRVVAALPYRPTPWPRVRRPGGSRATLPPACAHPGSAPSWEGGGGVLASCEARRHHTCPRSLGRWDEEEAKDPSEKEVAGRSER